MPAGDTPSSRVITCTRWTWQITVKLSAQGTKYHCWENEDQNLFMQPLPQELSCNDQGRSSDWPTLAAWSVLGAFCEHPHSSFSSPPLPPSETYLWILITLCYGLFERFDVLKRLVVAETDGDWRQCDEESALATGVCSHSCPMTKWNKLWDALQDWLISLAICVLLMKDKHVVLLTSKFQCEIRSEDLEIPPPRCYAIK